MKRNRKLFYLMVSLFLLTACLPITAQAQDAVPTDSWTEYIAKAFAGGSGTKKDPYQINSAEQLALLAKDVKDGISGKTHAQEYFILTEDIDLSAHKWEPIGYQDGPHSYKAFSGYFDGNGKKITGLYVDVGTENRSAGLFGCILAYSSEPMIQKLTIENGIVLAGNSTDNQQSYGAGLLIGTIAGSSYADYTAVENCTVSGTVSSKMRAGGFVGDANYTHFNNCHANVEVTGHCVSGGFVGNTFNSQLTNCTAKGSVNSQGWSTGGFAGVLFSNTTVDSCAAFGNVAAADWNLGGFAGYVEANVTIKNSIASGDVTSTLTRANPKTGGFAGTTIDTVHLKNCHATGKITTSSNSSDASIGGMIAVAETNTHAENCSYDREKNPSLTATGKGSSKTDSLNITAQDTAGVLAGICGSYYQGHDMVQKPKVEPTCTQNGMTAGEECTRCGHREGITVIAAFGHSYTDWSLDENKHWRQCIICGSKKDEGAHTDDDRDHKCDLCSKTLGECADMDNDHKCDTCGKTLSDHTGGTAICIAKAVCEICSKEYGELDPNTHANLVHVSAKEATREAEGNIEHWYCSGCKKYFSDSAASKEMSQADTLTISLAAPAAVKTRITGTGTITLTWKSIKGADGYQIYRAAGNSKTYKKIAAVKGKTSYADKKKTIGTKYTYKVRAYKGNTYTAFSKKVTRMARPFTPALTLKAGKKQVRLSWKSVKGADGYQIYRTTSKKGKYIKIADVSAGKKSFTNKGLKGGKKYYYKMRVYDKTGGKKVFSLYSKIKTVKAK